MSNANGKTRKGFRLTPGAERALDWYFGEGVASFERSSFGAQLERARSLAHRTETCRRCKGTGFSKSAGQCRKCLGMGALVYKRRIRRGPPTAQPKAATRPQPPSGPDEGLLARYAQVSRTLDRATQIDACARSVLWAYYGDLGARWARTKHGRIFALYVLTEPGKSLLAFSAPGAADLGLRPDERLGVEATLDETQPKDARSALLTRADLDARRLLMRACRAWNQSDPRR